MIERQGVNRGRAHIGRKYRKVHVLGSKLRDSKPAATLKSVVYLLNRVTKRDKTRSVDMLWMTHGLNNGDIQLQKAIVQKGKNTNKILSVEDDIAQEIGQRLSKKQRARFRILFSTACWGASHMKGWLKAGFKVASGSWAVFTDAAVSYPRFLNTWGKGRTFRMAVDKANTTLKHDLSDQRVAKMKRFKEYKVGSFRMTRGQTCMKIDSSPSTRCTRKKKPSKHRNEMKIVKIKSRIK